MQRTRYAIGITDRAFVPLSALFPHAAPRVHQPIGIVPATTVNFFLNSCRTFRQDADRP